MSSKNGNISPNGSLSNQPSQAKNGADETTRDAAGFSAKELAELYLLPLTPHEDITAITLWDKTV